MGRKQKSEPVNHRSRLLSVITDIRTIVVTVIAGIILAYIIQDARFAPQRNAAATPTLAVSLNMGSGDVKIQQGQMLALANEKGSAVVRFIFSEDGASYQWRYKKYESTEEKTGSGRLYENYAHTPTDKGNQVVDLGSLLEMKIEDLQVVWSMSGERSGWIYYDDLGVDVLDDSVFNTLDLSALKIKK